ncbi:MAG: hypothetical protein DHS20C14_13120 [Phycisphaeraceae bacterium]|nr:MAG: hypothetical protein DHS20C14_13120 [Phycisphaeraceae bacterium]
MADEKSNPEATPEAPSKPSKLPLLIVAGLMLAEGVLVYLGVGILGSGPQNAGAQIEGLDQLEREQQVEILLIEDRFQNMQSGRVWGWSAEVYLKVRKKNEADVQTVMERDAAEIKEGLAMIFRKAQDRHLREPGLETISRQLTNYVNRVFGVDSEGVPLVERVILPKLKGNPEDI